MIILLESFSKVGEKMELVDKSKLIEHMRQNPQVYYRETVYDYIVSGLLTEEELVRKYCLLTNRAYRHILKFPSRSDEEEERLPVPPNEVTEQIIPGNVDVLFFGVSGSGGKTCLMGSLMSLVGETSDFKYQQYNRNKKCDNKYGTYLAEYMRTNRLPPATDQCYIQVVNTQIKCNGKYQGVSFIEFAGEQVGALAGNSRDEGMSDGYLSPLLIKIMNNGNKKILFMTLDPTNLKDISVPFGIRESLWINQSDLLSCVVSHFMNNKKFMQNVIGFHLIISKSDIWLQGSLESSISQALNDCGANGLLLQIGKLCAVYNLNRHLHYRVDPIPFTIGRFMMGDTYDFDKSDALKMLHIIKDDLAAYSESRSVFDRLKSFFNS